MQRDLSGDSANCRTTGSLLKETDAPPGSGLPSRQGLMPGRHFPPRMEVHAMESPLEAERMAVDGEWHRCTVVTFGGKYEVGRMLGGTCCDTTRLDTSCRASAAAVELSGRLEKLLLVGECASSLICRDRTRGLLGADTEYHAGGLVCLGCGGEGPNAGEAPPLTSGAVCALCREGCFARGVIVRSILDAALGVCSALPCFAPSEHGTTLGGHTCVTFVAGSSVVQ